jgi:GntR family transcriptional regulator
MQLWFSRRSEVSLRDQLVTQIILGILGRELIPGERLPSTRQLARRFRLHPNTVSAAYRLLEHDNWIDSRRGSGVYVKRGHKERASDGALALDLLISGFFRSARDKGISSTEVRERIRYWLELQPPDHFLVIEPDVELRQILIAEMQDALTFSVDGCGLSDCGSASLLLGAIPVVLVNKIEDVRGRLPASTDVVALHIRPVGKSLAAYLPAPSESMVGVASRWPTFLKTARTMLIAAGFHPDCLILRDATKPSWQRGLPETTAVICDSLTARSLNGMGRVLTFQLLAESCLKELQEYEQSIRGPLTG